LRGKAEEVGETGREAKEGDEVFGAGVEVDDLGGGESMGFGDEGEIGPVVADGNVDAFADGGKMGVGLAADKGVDFVVRGEQRVKVDEQGAVGGVQVDEPGGIGMVQITEERDDLAVGGNGKLTAESGQKRRVAGRETFGHITHKI